MKKIVFIILILTVIRVEIRAQATIQEARNLGPGASVTITGIATNGDEFGVIRYVQDATAGIAAYGSAVSGVEPGDEVTISGTLKNWNNLLEIDPITSVNINSSGNSLPNAQIITPSQMDESYEAEIIRIDNAVFSDGGVFSGNTNYFVVASGQYAQIRINSNSNLVGQPIPMGEVSLIGICSQYSPTDPDEGYQLLLRSTDDIIPESAISFTSLLSIDNISTSGFDLHWTTDQSGSTEAYYGNTPALELGVLAGTGGSTDHTLSITGADPSEVFYVRAFSVKDGDTAYSGIYPSVFITQSTSSGEMTAYFNREVDHSVSSGVNATFIGTYMDDTLINYINRAQHSIDFTMYSWNESGMSSITNALNSAYARGVDVRVVHSYEPANSAIANLDAGIGTMRAPEPAYPAYGLMHNKFVVFDAYAPDASLSYVWTGSTNMTSQQVNTDPNNVLIIQDQSLAKAYTLEFNEMFGSNSTTPNASAAKFGPDKIDNTPHHFIIDGKEVECYFSPLENVNSRIIELINTADEELFIITMLITRTQIGYAIRDAANAGVNTKVIVNDEAECYETVVSTLAGALGENFKETGEIGIMHHKTMIIDQGFPGSNPVLLTGSHNWSASANDRNDENTLIIFDAELANIYYQEFVERFNNGIVITDLKEEKLNDHFTLYPNPVSSRLYFRSDIIGNEDANIHIMNVLGEVILHKSIGIEQINNEFMDVSSLSPGVYFVSVSLSGQSMIQKLVIQ